MLIDVAGNTVPVGDSENVICTYKTQIQKVTSVTLSKHSTTLVKSKDVPNPTETLTVTYGPDDANMANRTVTWSSSNLAIASVDETTGVITAKKAGTAIITATATDGASIKDSCTVTVEQKVTGISITESLTLNRFNDQPTGTIAVTYQPIDASAKYKKVTWSGIPSTIGISGEVNGTVTGKARTSPTRITATVKSDCGTGTDTCDVEVIQKVASISIPNEVAIVGNTVNLVKTINPTNANNQNVTWTSNNTGVATVNSSTGLVTTKTAGTATITATANDGGNTKGTCTITVHPVIMTFNYTGNVQNVTLPKGKYKLEVWGATGGGSLSGRNLNCSYKLWRIFNRNL